MPYEIQKRGTKWVIIRKIDNKVVGHSDSEAKAKASVRARYIGEHNK